MAAQWPEAIGFESVEVSLVDTRKLITGPNGAGQVADRAVRRHVARFRVPPLDQTQSAQVWAVLNNASRSTLIVQIPAAINAAPDVGTPAVNTAWSAGFELSVKSLASGAALPAGNWLSIQTGGRWYLYVVGATAAAGSTTRTVTMAGLPRVTHAVDDPVRIATARIQGYLSFSPRLTNYNLYDGFDFEVREI